jgi:hypothetical protein
MTDGNLAKGNLRRADDLRVPASGHADRFREEILGTRASAVQLFSTPIEKKKRFALG